MRLTPDQIRSRLMEGAWFAQLPPAFREMLSQAGRVTAMAAGAPLFVRGDDADGLYCVLDGAVEIGAVGVGGHEAVLAVVEATMWFGEIAIIDGGVRTHDARASRDSVVLHVPRRAVTALLTERPELWRHLALLTTDKLRLAFEVAEASVLLSPAQRLAGRLLMIADGYGGIGAPRAEIRLSQEKLGAMVALSRQTVNRILKRFEAQGLIAVQPGVVILMDVAGLRTEAR